MSQASAPGGTRQRSAFYFYSSRHTALPTRPASVAVGPCLDRNAAHTSLHFTSRASRPKVTVVTWGRLALTSAVCTVTCQPSVHRSDRSAPVVRSSCSFAWKSPVPVPVLWVVVHPSTHFSSNAIRRLARPDVSESCTSCRRDFLFVFWRELWAGGVSRIYPIRRAAVLSNVDAN